jgi:hypothetical protein
MRLAEEGREMQFDMRHVALQTGHSTVGNKLCSMSLTQIGELSY